MTDSRENWTSRSGFIIAAVGSAVGLGKFGAFHTLHMKMVVVRFLFLTYLHSLLLVYRYYF